MLLQEVPGGGSYGLPQPVTSVTGFAMTHCKECGRRAVGDAGPYGMRCRGGRLCPPGPGNAKPCRAGPVCPAGVRRKEESPSHGFAVPAPFRQGGRKDGDCGLPQPVTSVTGLAMTHLKNSPCHSEPVRTPAWESASFVGTDGPVRPV